MSGKHKLSPAQNSAANPRKNVWVQANAGTGKTYVLVLRLLRILFNSTDADAGGILCLTYTKAGAGEMRNRILARLREWAMMPDDKLRDLLSDVSDNPVVSDDDIARARAIFFRYIDNPDILKIKTIHSFCEEILRRFPIEAGVSPSWTLVSDADERALQYDAFVRMINTVDDVRVNDAFMHLVGRITENSLADLAQVLTGQYKFFYKINNIDKYREYFIDTICKFLELSKPLPTLNPDKCLASALFELENAKKAGATLTGFVTVAKQFIDKTIDFEEYKKLFLNADGTPCNSNRKLAGTRDYLADEKDAVYAISQHNINQLIFDDTVAMFDMAAAYARSYRDLKHQRNLLDFEDLVLYTHNLFSKPDVMGWVLSQLDLSLKHILVDEAQDTSRTQWDLLRMLAGEFFVGGDTDVMPHSMFVVGDTKQSIYSFQGADPHAFAESRAEMAAQLKNNARDIELVALDKSFRSLPAILKTVDVFFSDETIARDTGFENDAHTWHRDAPDGMVELHRLITSKADDVTQPDYIRIIADKIQSVIDSGAYSAGDIMVLVRSRGTKVDQLVKELKRRNISVEGSDRIWLPNFPAVRDMLNVVRFCLNNTDDYSLCCVLKSPIFRLKEVDIYNICKIRNDENKSRRQGDSNAQTITVFDVLKDYRPDIHERITQMIVWAQTMGPYSFFSSLLNNGVRTEMIAALGTQIVDPLEEFMTLCLSYERTQPGTLHHFLKWFITGGSQVKRDMNAAGVKSADLIVEWGRAIIRALVALGSDVAPDMLLSTVKLILTAGSYVGAKNGVRIVTIHGSKGLEAPVIFMLDTAEIAGKGARAAKNIIPLAGGDAWLWTAQKPNSELYDSAESVTGRGQLEEYYRLLYVAMTRARDRLYIYGYTTEQEAPALSWHARLWDVLSRAPNALVTEDMIRIGHE